MLGAVMEKSNAAGPEAGLYEAFKVASLLASEFLTTQQVADVLAVTKWTLAYWRKRREGPPYVKLARGTIRYPKAAFEVYLKSQLQRRGLGKRQAATSLGEGSKMKSREKTSGKYSARSKRTEQAEKVLRIHREKVDRALAEVGKAILDLEEGTKKLSREMADTPNNRTEEKLQRGLADIETKRSLIKIYERDRANTEAQIQKLVPSPEQARERLEGQCRLERLAGERLEKDLQADGLLNKLCATLRERLRLGAEMAKLAASLDIRLEHDGLDDSRFKELLYSLPGEVSGASKRWLASFILGMPEGANAYVVCDQYLEVRETLAHHGIYRAGESICLTEEEARELLRRDRPESQSKPGGDWAPPSVIALEEYQAAEADAKKKGIGVEVALFLVQRQYELEEKKRRAALKDGGQAPVPVTQLASYDTGRQ